MIGEGASRDCSIPRTSSSGKKPKGSCKLRGNLDNVVIIDIDSCGFDDVIIIDVPESLQQKLRGSSVLRDGKRFPIQGIIQIDDDGSHYLDHSEFNVEDNGAFDNDDIPRRTRGATNCMQQSEDSGVAQESRPAFKLSKCKNSYINESCRRNRYGLNSESESDFSESDSSDCEVIEGSSSELREQWEKICLKRKSNIYYQSHSGLQDQVSPCSSQTDPQPNVKEGNGAKQNSGTSVFSGEKNVNFREVNSSDFTPTEDGFIGGGFNPWMEGGFAKSDDKIHEESFSWWSNPKSKENSGSYQKGDVSMRGETCTEGCNCCCNECLCVNRCGTGLTNEGSDPCGPSPWSIHKAASKEFYGTKSCFQHSEQRTVREHAFPRPLMMPNLDSDKEGPSVQDQEEDGSLYKDQCLGEMHSVTLEKDLKFTEATSSGNICSDEAQCESIDPKVKDKVVSGISNYAEGQNPFSIPISNIQICDGKNPIDAPFDDVLSTVQKDITNERERLKETDDYKQVVEEEWAARQRQLQIQAEEAKRLKKRQKAETLRILDMEKRQKQRLEEVRETQRKDEENLNMKEDLRAEVRKELYKLEGRCTDMASVLRGLGIHVEGGFFPFLQEVHAAYKRALLKFHPDRASRTNIRQQVEAEEKFKLISRMKEKFLSP